MIFRYLIVGIIFLLNQLTINAQLKDSTKILKEVIVTGYKTVNGIGHLMEIKDGIIYAGKKTEIILVDSLNANKAINNTRQVLGRIPGLNIVETESSGFTANGIATRGLNPTQSIEVNTRQNGYNISADVYGYNEAYYLPPMEAVQRIELIRGASSLQFGPQFGGLVNYITADAPANQPFEFITSQTMGSFGMFNTFNSLGGHFKKISYYGFLQYRYMDGYRPNSRQWQLSGFGKILFTVSPRFNIGMEYSLLRNKIQMPGGLTDSLFDANPKASTRTRNWLKTPWNIISNSLNYQLSEQTNLSLKTTYNFSNRSLVWRNEDGGPGEPDEIDPVTNAFVPREVGIEDMQSITSEARISGSYKTATNEATFAGGVRFSFAKFKRRGGGEGTTNSDFDLSVTGDWGYHLNFTTTNFAPFAENIFRIGNHLTLTPGFRAEFLNSTVNGYKFDDVYKVTTDQRRNRFFILGGFGIEYKTSFNAGFYGNISQAYRPIEYGQLQPFGRTAIIDPDLKDAKGFNSDLGYRFSQKNFLNADISLFYIAYNNRIGEVIKTDPATGDTYAYRTNIANSRHMGIESYIEFDLLKCMNPTSEKGVSVFNALSLINATYTNGEFKGNRVEAAAKIIERTGVTFKNKKLSSTFQLSYTGDAYGDASNVRTSTNPVAGYIPAYTVLDFSLTYKINNYFLKCGINNLGNKAYFTRRTDEYPGPGIIPAVGRSIYAGFTAKF